MLKKLSAGGYFNLIAIICALVGVVLVYVGHAVSAANGLLNIGSVILLGIAGVVFAIVALEMSLKKGNHNIVTALTTLAAIGLNIYVIGTSVSQRILMIAGLFSYNSNNMEGWKVFYINVVAWVLLLVASIFMIISSFLKTVKE